ncbi:hypothetical protein [Saccharospirillum mangrovi]|uniref:hypothetical protein n=1 Tax=Saccharospirillum mangrovi TaxID=2161747 RepID=UPI000D35E39C|nr:hypothetical protein [Saccharospirillum mangrovi]
MKAIKIASGVAVTALAAAISAQAHAEMDTETSWSFTGSMEFLTVVDMADGITNVDGDDVTSIDVELDEEDDFDSGDAGDGFGMESTLAVTHGPFSANLVFTADDEAGVTTEVNDIIITDGAISFGQIDSLVDLTQEYAFDMDDSGDDIGSASEGFDVDAGLRYTMGDLKVQLEGVNRKESDGFTSPTFTVANIPTSVSDADGDGTILNSQTDIDAATAYVNSSDYGVAAQYVSEADALSYVVEAQVRTSSLGGEDDLPYIYVGAGATYTMDMVTAKVGANRYTVSVTDANDTAILEYGFELTVTPIDALSVYVNGQDLDMGGEVIEDTSMKLLFGAAYTIDTITVTGEYTFTEEEEAGDEIYGEVAYADGPVAAYAGVTLGNFDAEEADELLYEAGASYTQDNGVVYAADYDFQTDGANNLRLSAAYAF